jgi:SulP family sulfate permease
VVHIEGNLFFGSADLLLGQIRLVCKRPALKVVILKLRGVSYIDATCLLAMEELLRYMKAHNRRLLLTEVGEAAFQTLELSGLIDKIGTDHVFKDDKLQTHKAITSALNCAKELIGHGKITVRVLAKPIIDPHAAEPLDPTVNVSLHKRNVQIIPK